MDDNTTPQVHDDDESLDYRSDDMTTYADSAVAPSDEYDDGSLDDDYEHEDGFDLNGAVAVAGESGDAPVDQLRNLVAWIVNQLVDEPENVQVDAVERGASVQVQVRLPEADLGKVIGRGGRIAKSIRTALMIVGSRHHMRVSLDIEGQS